MKKFETIISGVKVIFEVVDEDKFKEVVDREGEMEFFDYESTIFTKEEALRKLKGAKIGIEKDNFTDIESVVLNMAWHEYLINVVDAFNKGIRKDDIEEYNKKRAMIEEMNEMVRKMSEVI